MSNSESGSRKEINWDNVARDKDPEPPLEPKPGLWLIIKAAVLRHPKLAALGFAVVVGFFQSMGGYAWRALSWVWGA